MDGHTCQAAAQSLQDRPVAPPGPVVESATTPVAADQVQFSAGTLEYDYNADIVTATGEVRMTREGDRLRADKVEWNRKTGRVVATGNVVHDDIVELTQEKFSQITDGANAAPEKAVYRGGEAREMRELEQVHYLLGFEGLAYDDPDFYAAQVLATVMGGGMSSRLFQEVRERRGLAYSIFAFSSSYIDSGVFGIYAGTGENDVSELVPVLCEEIQRAGLDIDEVETARARAQHKASIMMGLEAAGARAEQLGRQMHVYGRHLPPAELVAEIDRVDAEAVRRVANRLRKSAPVVAAIGPLGKLESYQTTAGRLS